MKHLSEEQLLDRYFGDLPEDEARHLDQCEECRAMFERQGEVLDATRDYPVPERGPAYGGEVWARVLPHLPLENTKRSWFPWLLTPVLAGLLAVAFFTGRWTKVESIPERAKERVLLLTLSEHLERSQIVLAELANAEGSADLLEERDRARELVGANRLLRQTAQRLGDARDAAILEDLEHVLLEVANAPENPTDEDASRVQRRIASNELLFKVRVASLGTKERGMKL